MYVIYKGIGCKIENLPVRENGECGMSALKVTDGSKEVEIIKPNGRKKKVALRELTFK